MNESVVTYRYPGIKPYTEDQQHIFHGRKGDVDKLYEMLMERPVMTLYAQSGMGKSSLINAGLIPKFHAETAKNNFLPLRIRFGIYEPEIETPGSEISLPLLPIEILLYELRQYLQSHNMVELPFLEADAGHELWYLIKRFEVNQIKLLLIFDQAEELFTYPVEAILKLKEQLYSIANSRIPDVFDKAIGEKMKQLKAGTPEELKRIDAALELIYQSIDSRILFVVRDDMLGSFKSFEDLFPNILKDTYHLLALSGEGASEAIRLPAMQEGRFLSLPFSFTEGAFQKMLNNLIEKDGRFDPFSIQLNCRYIERVLTMNGHLEIDETDIPEEARAVNDFLDAVWKSVELVAQDDVESIRTKLTDKLIDFTLEKRISASDGPWLDRRAKPVLLKEGLIKEDNWGGVDYIELSHDRLIRSMIEESRTRRLAEQERALLAERERASREEGLKEEALAARRKADEAEAKAIQDRDKALRARRMGKVYLGMTIIAFALAILYNVKMRRERINFRESYTRAMTSSAEIAYRDNNDALAFNLIYERDSVLGLTGQAHTDSGWDLLSYSGLSVKTRSEDSLIACQMVNRVLRIFYLKDSLRRDTPYFVIQSVDKFLLPKGSNDLYTLNAADTVIRRYRMVKENGKLLAKLVDSMKNSSMGYNNFPDAFKVIGNGLFLIHSKGSKDFRIVKMEGGRELMVFAQKLPELKVNKTKVQSYIRQVCFDSVARIVYLNIARMVKDSLYAEVWEAHVSRSFSQPTIQRNSFLAPYSGAAVGITIYNSEKRRLLIIKYGKPVRTEQLALPRGFAMDSASPIHYLRFTRDMGDNQGLSAFYDLRREKMIAAKENKDSIIFNWSQWGRRVQSSRPGFLFINGDSLCYLDINSHPGIWRTIKNFPGKNYDYYFETEDGSKILCFRRADNSMGIINTGLMSFEPKQYQVIFSELLPLGFISGSVKGKPGVFRIEDLKGHNADYWRNFYEGFTPEEQKKYGIKTKQ